MFGMAVIGIVNAAEGPALKIRLMPTWKLPMACNRVRVWFDAAGANRQWA